MKLPIIIFSLTVFLLFVQCTNSTKTNSKTTVQKTFTFPTLQGNLGNGEYIDTSNQLASKSYFYENTSPIKSVIDFNSLVYYYDYFKMIPDSLPFSITNKVDLFVDNSQEFTMKFRESYFPPPPGIDAFGNFIDEYYPPYDSVKVLPAFIVNYTDSIQGIENHDGKIIMIQEALNSKSEWLPIEYFSFSGCGNSYGIHFLDTNCYLMFGVHKYKGDFKTKLRVRLITNGHTILSNEYAGYINNGQFKQEGIDSMHHNYLKDGY